ncbi:MAG: type IV toxin-antitoxin system AbiEi family antitoxin domain-containing protein [Planctomycetota bacterium]|jgi:predicted transcriptional regulator of viral defense system
MKWPELLQNVSDSPVFTTGLVAAGEDLAQVRLQLSRWVKDGRLIKLRRGLYALTEPYRKAAPEPFYVANALKSASYVSLQSALGYYGLIPEFVPVVTSVTTKRPQSYHTKLGDYEFKHIKKDLFYGFRQLEVVSGQSVFIALSEKALLDLIYLTPDADNPHYLAELRLQGLESLDLDLLQQLAEKSGSKKLMRATKVIFELARKELGEQP